MTLPTTARTGQRMLLAMAALAIGAVVAVVGFILWTAREFDVAEVGKARRLAAVAMAGKLDQLRHNVGDWSLWSDAYAHLHLATDLQWAYDNQNLGPTLYPVFGYEWLFVVGPDGATTYAVEEGKLSPERAEAIVGDGLRPLLAAAVADPTAPGAAGLVRAKGGLAMVAAAPIRTTQDYAGPRRDGPPTILVYLDLLDDDVLRAMADGYLLRGLTLSDAPGGPAAIALRGLNDEPLGFLTWRPERPGGHLLATVLPAVGLVLATVGALTLLVLRSGRRAVQALEQSEARFKDVATAASDWIFELGPDLRLTYLSDRFHAVTGIGAGAALGAAIGTVLEIDKGAPLTWDRLTSPSRGQGGLIRDLRCRFPRADGAPGVCRVSIMAVAAGGRLLGYRGTATDITAQEHALFLSLHDPLTGLPNRRLLGERLGEVLGQARPGGQRAALLCLDLDRFKPVNDRLGHAAGDAVLRAAGERLSACVRRGDLVARLGGDEFAVLQPCVDGEAAVAALCRRLLHELGLPIAVEGGEVTIGASIGVVILPDGAADAAGALRRGDAALYRAKAEGRGTFRFHAPEMGVEA